jgi:tRNA G18 (ribose-2'-O)-methylase SpoU
MIIKEITSPQNPTFLKFLKLQHGQEIKKAGLTFLSGPKQVQEVIRDYPEYCAAILLNRDHEPPQGVGSRSIYFYRFTPRLFQKLDLYGTGQPLLIIKAEALPLWSDKNWIPGCTLFIPFQDPINVGAVVRSAAAFGVSCLVILKEAAHPFHHKAIRVAGSTVFRIPIFRGPSIKDLPESRFPIFTLSPKGKDLSSFRFPDTFGLLPGMEGPGIPSDLSRLTALGIPMQNQVESLNAATATGIALYLWHLQSAQ